MFVRIIKSKGFEYLNIVESYRKEGKSRHRNVASLGRLDKLENSDQLVKIAQALLKYCKQNNTIFDVSTAEEKARKNWGAVGVWRHLWDKFELDRMFAKLLESRKTEFDFFSAVFLMVMDRLVEPKSKKKTYEEREKYHGIEENALHHLYRALDILADGKDEIEKFLFDRNVSLFNMKVNVVLYDVTSVYFESMRADDLRGFGFSKDCKFKEVQVILGLLVDMEGRPIGFDLFPGNTFERHTLARAIEKLRQRFQINRVIIIGDRAMVSKENIETIKKAEYEYVVGSRTKNLPKKIKESILDETGYVEFVVKSDDDDESFKFKELELNGDRLVCCRSSRRAKKDRADRDRLIQKAQKMLKNKNTIVSKRGALKYIDFAVKSQKKIDYQKIEDDEKWDGYYGIQTNCKKLAPNEVSEIYHQLWRIEEAFRIFKSHLEIRPVFIWTPKRIKGHFVLCFIAFLLERTLELELRKKGIAYSTGKIRKSLNQLQFSEVEIEGQMFYLRSKVEGLSAKILRILRIKIPQKIATPDKF